MMIALLIAGLLVKEALPTTPTTKPRSAEDFFYKADIDRDGRLSLEEFQNQSWIDGLAMYDRNKDGVISFEEEADVACPGRQGDCRGHFLPAFQAVDANKDGKIERNEDNAANFRAFQRLDLNHDGWLTREEISPPLRR